MYLLTRSLMILSAIVLIANQFNCLDSDSGGLFDGFNKILPRFSAKKEESKGWGLSNFRIFSSNEKPKESEQKSNWLPNLSNIVSKEPKKESKSWFPNLKILSLVSTKDELPIDQLSSKDASKSNLTIFNWQFVNFNLTNQNNLTNFNFTNWDLFKWSNYTNLYNFTNLTNWNTTNLLNFNSNKDWFIFLKARYYSNLLNNRTLFNYSSSSSSNDTINSTSLDTSLNASNTSNSSSSSTFLNASSIADNASINNSNYSMNFTLFRDRLIKVYDNLTLCEHPCKNREAKKDVNNLISINGCGPNYFSERQLSMIPYGEFFRDCCNAHDTNYSECGYKKQEADYNFLDCMLNLINKTSLEDKYSWPRIRKTFGYALFGMVDIFGCKVWSITQQEVCSCD